MRRTAQRGVSCGVGDRLTHSRQNLTYQENSSDQAAEQVATDLTDGLKSCRAMLNDYRAKISGVPLANNSNQPEELDQSSAG